MDDTNLDLVAVKLRLNAERARALDRIAKLDREFTAIVTSSAAARPAETASMTRKVRRLPSSGSTLQRCWFKNGSTLRQSMRRYGK